MSSANGSSPWNPNFAAILMPVSGCGLSGVNSWLLIDQRNLSVGSARAFFAATTALTLAPMNSRRLNIGVSSHSGSEVPPYALLTPCPLPLTPSPLASSVWHLPLGECASFVRQLHARPVSDSDAIFDQGLEIIHARRVQREDVVGLHGAHDP